jgi:maltooligosyltrehalose trehalohydrolase
MEPSGGGWWDAGRSTFPGTDYGFSIDNAIEVLPDPRSCWQPYGVHGLSRSVDHSEFEWTDQDWAPPPLSSAVIYELHVGTFTPAGTFEAAIEKLAHLRALGVTHVELMPVAEFPGDWGWGYDGVDLYAPHHCYGGPHGLKRLVNACHAAGLAVLLDVVYNHLGPDGNYLSRFGPYMTTRYKTPWGEAINLDGPGSDEVRRYICDNALMWVGDYHIDGLRLDAIHALIDRSAVHLLEQLAAEVKAFERESGRRAVLIPESDLNDPRLLWPAERGGYSLDAQWSDDFHHAIHALLTGEDSGYYADFGGIDQLAYAYRHAYVYDGRYSAYRRRTHGRAATGLTGDRFVVYMQTHDQIGNRASGDRSNHLMNRRKLKIAAGLVLTAPFLPMLFQGEEWAASAPFQYATNHQDEVLGHAVSAGRRAEFIAFGWKPEDVPDPQARETFERSKLDWSELSEPEHRDMLEWHRQLIGFRKSHPAMRDFHLDRLQVEFDESIGWLRVDRAGCSLACNVVPAEVTVPLPPGTRRVVIASDAAVRIEGGRLVLPGESFAIVTADDTG